MKRNILFVFFAAIIVALGAVSFYSFKDRKKSNAEIIALQSEKQLLIDSLAHINEQQKLVVELIDSLLNSNLIHEEIATEDPISTEGIKEGLYIIADKLTEDKASIGKLKNINLEFARNLIAEKQKSHSIDSIYNKESFVWQQQKNNFLARLEREEMTKQALHNSRDSILASFGKLIYRNIAGIEVTYVGSKQNNRAEGFGIGLYAAKGTYVGLWQNGRRHGQGMYKWLNGDKYEGHYNQGVRDGFGIYYFSDGSRFEGEWKNDQRNGEGVFYSSDNKIISKGIWKDDKRLQIQAPKKAALTDTINPV